MIIMIKVFRCGAVVDDPSSGHVKSPDNNGKREETIDGTPVEYSKLYTGNK